MSRVVPKSGEPVSPAERGYISDMLKLQVLVANGGRCCRCDKRLGKGDTEFDHVLPVWMGGLTELGNLLPMCAACHSKKTALDAADRAKTKRLQLKNMPHSDENVEPKPGRNAIRNKGFDPTKTRRFDGKVVAREARS
jgi:hypothetical protein